MNQKIATSSIEEGLDFACNLLISGLQIDAETNPNRSPELLRYVAQYIQFETMLALEYLVDIGNMLDQDTYNAAQFWAQLRWVAGKMDLSSAELANLGIKSI
jgi:hypothetical protein